MRADQLVFLISQPRSGSTMLQHILASHTNIVTVPEPWFMLPLFYMRREHGTESEYNAYYAARALGSYLDAIEAGAGVYRNAVREMALQLYAARHRGSGAGLFLDKTPRYYHIIPELADTFPEARFVFLTRNPLAVLTSIAQVNGRGSYRVFMERDRRHDVLSAPRLILDGIGALGGRAIRVSYEEFVRNPERESMRLCGHLGVDYEAEMLEYGSVRFDDTPFVDPKSIYRHRQAVKDYTDAWCKDLTTPYRRALTRGYLERLGRATVTALGYSYARLSEDVGPVSGPLLSASRRFWARDIDPRPARRSSQALYAFFGKLHNEGTLPALAKAAHALASRMRSRA